MDIEHILVFFGSPDGRMWTPVERENIPDWLRDEVIINRMLAGEMVRRAEDNPARYYRVVEPIRPRQAGYYRAMAGAVRSSLEH